MTCQIGEIASPVEQDVEPVEGSQKRQVRSHALRPNRRQADGRVDMLHQENRRRMIANEDDCGPWARSLDQLLRLSFALVSPPYLFNSFPPLH
jgi:hypothetical protein